MYYICNWYSGYIVFDDIDKKLAQESGKDIFKAIYNFKKSAWNTTIQPDRNIRVENNSLIYGDDFHKVIYQLPHLNITKESHPEFFI